MREVKNQMATHLRTEVSAIDTGLPAELVELLGDGGLLPGLIHGVNVAAPATKQWSCPVELLRSRGVLPQEEK